MNKSIGFGALGIVVFLVGAIFLPTLDAVMRRQGAREIEELCEKVLKGASTQESYGRDEVRKALLRRARGVRESYDAGTDVEVYTFQVGIFPWGAMHRATIRVSYRGGRVQDVEPALPRDL